MLHTELLIHYCANILYKVCQYWPIKASLSLFFVIAAFLFDPNLNTQMWALLALIVFDMLTAIISELKNGNPIQSRKMFKSAVKIVIYFLLVSAGFMVEHTIPLRLIDEAVIGFLALTELVSVIENFGRAGYSVPKQLLAQLKKLKYEK